MVRKSGLVSKRDVSVQNHAARRKISAFLSVFRNEWIVFPFLFFIVMVNGQKKERCCTARSAPCFEQSRRHRAAGWGARPELLPAFAWRWHPGMRGGKREPRRGAFGSVSVKEERSFCVFC